MEIQKYVGDPQISHCQLKSAVLNVYGNSLQTTSNQACCFEVLNKDSSEKHAQKRGSKKKTPDNHKKHVKQIQFKIKHAIMHLPLMQSTSFFAKIKVKTYISNFGYMENKRKHMGVF